MDRADYVSKMLNILNDTSKFKHLGPASQFDFTYKIEQAFQRRLRKFFAENSISQLAYDTIRPVGSQRPKMYGLPKTHKAGIPLRPVLSLIGSPQHKLAKWLVSELQPVLHRFSKYCVKDSFSFSTIVNNFDLNSSSSLSSPFMCSFDVKSLFTNVPLLEVIDICVHEMYSGDIKQSIPRAVFRELLIMATSGVEFSFDNQMYRQVDGVAMGSPLGPILADIFMGYHEKKLFESSEEPLMYYRYVDDTFVLFKDQAQSVSFHHLLSGLHPSLSFTMEGEVDSKLAFLDVMVQRVSSSFKTSVHRKKTFTGEYVSWSSFSPTKRKINLISCLVERAVNICSPSLLDQEIEVIRNIFRNLGYPENIVDRVIKAKLTSKASITPYGPQKCPVYLRLPYIGPVSNRFQHQASSAVGACFGSVRLRVIFGTRSLLRSHVKDRSPTLDSSNVVYKYTCACDSVYVGRTSNRLHARIDQHVPRGLLKQLNSPKPATTVTSSKKTITAAYNHLSAIGQHLVDNPECAKDFCRERFTVLVRARSEFHLSVMESINIQTMQPPLCRQKNFVYSTVLFKMLT